MRAILRALTSLVARARFEREMREQLRFHIERRAEDLIAAGESREEALRRARVEFGALESLKEQCRDESGFAPLRPLHEFGGDLKLAARPLAATPLFTTFAVLVPVPLLLAAFFACWLPAHRASRVDPMVALRHL